MNAVRSFDEAIFGIIKGLRDILLKIPNEVKSSAQEVRLRVNKPIIIHDRSKTYFISKNGNLFQNPEKDILTVNRSEIIQSFRNMCNYSVYSHQEEIKNGFITMRGGHRVGICGTAVIDNSKIVNLRDISSLNIRVAREIHGSASELIKILMTENSNRFSTGSSNHNTDKYENFGKPFLDLRYKLNGLLIVGPPACGKTTLLRDLAKQLSENFIKVSVIDERGEIGAVNLGVCQNDLGFCDVLNGYTKGEGILQAVRSLSPDIIICDEIGKKQEVEAIEEGLNCGVGIIASVHAAGMEEMRKRPQVKALLSTGAFKKVILLDNSNNPGSIKGIYKIGDVGV